MGQKANTQTLRLNNHNINGLSLLKKEAINSISFIENLKYCLSKKHIYLIDSTLNFRNTTGDLELCVFYKSKWFFLQKRRKRRKKRKKSLSSRLKRHILVKKSKNFLIEKTILRKKICKNKILKKQIIKKNRLFSNLLKNNLLFLTIKNLNKIALKNKQSIRVLHYILNRQFKAKLFSRRHHLYKDFIKISCLFLMKKITADAYVNILGTIFKILPKKLHSTYSRLIQNLFLFLINDSFSTIQGIKLIINGKFKGKLRASIVNFSIGKIKAQSLSADVSYAKTFVITMYGSFGFRLWINYKINNKLLLYMGKKKNKEKKEKKKNPLPPFKRRVKQNRFY